MTAPPTFEHDREPRLGRTQQLLLGEVRRETLAWLADAETKHLATNASMTLLRLYNNCPGHTGKELERSADALVVRGLLRRTKVGWALSASEFSRLVSQSQECLDARSEISSE